MTLCLDPGCRLVARHHKPRAARAARAAQLRQFTHVRSGMSKFLADGLKQALVPGTRVRIQGLRGAPELNGLEAG